MNEEAYPTPQADEFGELGCDEDEQAFEEKVKKVAGTAPKADARTKPE